MIGNGKLLMGILSLSFFACANAFYTYGIVLAKICAIWGMKYHKQRQRQCDFYQKSGVILLISSLAYLLYALHNIADPAHTVYNQYQGILIAFITFVEIGWNIRGMVIERQHDDMMYHALRSISFASSLISLVLTQTAILSFTAMSEGYQHDASANGYLGVIMALAATIVALFMIFRSKKMRYG